MKALLVKRTQPKLTQGNLGNRGRTPIRLSPARLPTAFPPKVSYNAPTASFRMAAITPVYAPEPGSLALLLLSGGGGGGLLAPVGVAASGWRRRQEQA